MSEPKLTVGRVETWRPIDEVKAMDAGTWWLARQINSRMAALFPPAPQPCETCPVCSYQRSETTTCRCGKLMLVLRPALQPEPKPEPDYSCPICGVDVRNPCTHGAWAAIAAANASIAELARERDEARAVFAKRASEVEAIGYDAGYAKGASAAKEACANRLETAAIINIQKFEASRIVRMTEVPGP